MNILISGWTVLSLLIKPVNHSQTYVNPERYMSMALGVRLRGYSGVTAKGNRLVVEAVLYRYRAGRSWRNLPIYLAASITWLN
jgi:hypothetical protein